MTETLTSGTASVTIDHAAGGRLSSLIVSGHELLVTRAERSGDEMSWGFFPMAPWAGRIRHGRFSVVGRDVQLPLAMPPHAIHGTTLHKPWQRTGPGRLETDLGPDWPWTGVAQQSVELTEGCLSLTITIEARGDAPMPVTAGWHPWFRRRIGGVAVELDVPAERMWHRDGEGLPDGTLVEPTPGPWDDCFTALVGPVELHWPGVLRLYVESDCDHVVVYDEPADAVCVEPQSAPPDAHNSGEDLVFLDPGEEWSVTSTWLWADG